MVLVEALCWFLVREEVDELDVVVREEVVL